MEVIECIRKPLMEGVLERGREEQCPAVKGVETTFAVFAEASANPSEEQCPAVKGVETFRHSRRPEGVRPVKSNAPL